MKKKEYKCIWVFNDDGGGFFDTECGEAFCFDGGSIDKEFKYCPYCGRKIEESDCPF
jgi:hypothetical protein